MTYQPSSTAADPWPRSEPPALTPGAEQRELRSAVRGLLTKHSDVASTRDIAETEPGIQGDRVSGATKPATLETGKVIKVPLFINQGDRVKVDTRSGEYISKA